MNEFEVDFYKEFKLKPPIAGLVNKVTSPKGTRRLEETGRYTYHIKEELVQVYDEKPCTVTPGLYWVMLITKDITTLYGGPKWYHYLFIVDLDGDVYPIFEYLEAKDTSWVKEALPYIKKYFSEEHLDRIRLTPYKKPAKTKSWQK